MRPSAHQPARSPASKTAVSKTLVLGVFGLLVLGVAAFANSIRDDAFIFDDQMWFAQLSSQSSIWSETFWLAGNEGPQHGRPLAAGSLALNYYFSGDDLSGYRAVNLAIHILSGISLFFVLRLLFSSEGAGTLHRWAEPLAWCCAAIWLTHPLQTECVNYISQRTESLASLGLLLTIYFSLRARDQGPQQLGWMILACVAAWIAAGCKETAALAPLLVALVEWGASNGNWKTIRSRATYYVALATVWIPVSVLMMLAPRSSTVGAGEKAGVVRYLLNQCVILPDYLRLAFWPSSLAIDYGEPTHVAFAEAAPGGLFLLLLLGLGAILLVRRPLFGVAIWWIFLTLAPTSSFIPIQTEVGAERRMYLPLAAVVAGSLAAFAFAVKRFLVASREARQTGALRTQWGVALSASLLLIVPLSFRTRSRNEEYRDALRLWQSSFEARPNNPRAIYNLGVRLSHLGQVDAAIAAYRITLEIDPNYVTAHNNLGLSLREQGDYAGAQTHFHEAATRYKNWTLALNNLARLYAACPDAAYRNGAEAVRIAEAICRSHPGQAPYLETLAAAYAEQGQFDLAVKKLEEAKLLNSEGSAARFDPLIKQYQRGEPFRFPAPRRPFMVRRDGDPVAPETHGATQSRAPSS